MTTIRRLIRGWTPGSGPASRRLAAVGAAALALSLAARAGIAAAGAPPAPPTRPTTTPIKHLVVIYFENRTFDNLFATYPHAANPTGEPAFHAAPGTPTVNGLSGYLLTHNPNLANPVRLDRTQEITCSYDHDYTPEQESVDRGLLDKFVQYDGAMAGCASDPTGVGVMDYYDGNTVTGLWNYAQHFALSDNSFSTNFGPSTTGHLNLISGETHGTIVTYPNGTTSDNNAGTVLNGTEYSDPDPTLDDCSDHTGPTITMTGKNIGDLLNAKGITWGWFQGGFTPTVAATATSPAVCGSAHDNIAGVRIRNYDQGHEPFQYYRSTANPHHLPPSAVAMIGHTDQANHQYGLRSFWAAADAGNLPAVSFLKPPSYEDMHPGDSDPLDAQRFLVDTVNRLEQLPTWPSTAVILAWDDTGGWYDHVMPPIVNQSNSAPDALTGPGSCGTAAPGAYESRCGYGQRLPLLVISSWARVNFVDHSITDQTSILRFIEDNWRLGRIGGQSMDAAAGSLVHMFAFRRGPRAPRLYLNPVTGEPGAPPAGPH